MKESHKGLAAKGDKHKSRLSSHEPWNLLHVQRAAVWGYGEDPISSLSTEEGAQERACRMWVVHDGRAFWNQAGDAAGKSQQLGDVQQ